MLTNQSIPSDGIKGLKENWRSDVLAGFIIFLIALPLSLGIAAASGAPPIAGIIAAVVGGMLVSFLGGSYVTINGPAAGLIVVCLHAIETLGRGDKLLGFELFLAAIVVVGIIQIVLGLLRAGILATFFPPSVIHGMLTSIGIIIIAKQIHVAFGSHPESKSIIGLLVEVPTDILHWNLNPEIAFIGLACLIIAIVWPMIKIKYLNYIPAPLVAVLAGVAMGQYFDLDHSHPYLFLEHKFELGPNFLVNLPQNMDKIFTFPNFSRTLTMDFFLAVFSIFFVNSLESILSTVAVDKLDPYQRKSDLNREFIGKGIGNMILGFIGGIPIISEIVRSSANVQNGAKTKWANFFHGFFLLTFILSIPHLIHEIPMAALAAILVVVGYRLASPKEFVKTYRIGLDQITLFVVTILFTLIEDLLVGIFAGLIVKLLLDIYHGHSFKYFFKPNIEITENAYECNILIKDSLVFWNLFLVIKKLHSLSGSGKKVTLDFSKATLLDHTTMENIHSFQADYKQRGGEFILLGIDKLNATSSHPFATRITKKVFI